MWTIQHGDGPLVVTAIHDGHDLRGEVAALMLLSDEDRLREEDPYTGEWTALGNTRITVQRSRFEVDLNRPREKAVYRTPEDAWGLELWKEAPSADLVARSLAQYDAFYSEVHRLCCELQERYGHFVVLDLHSYNYRRGGPHSEAEDPVANPEVNIGSGSMDRDRWGRLLDRFMDDLRAYDYDGRHLDVRENVKFKGGQLSRWLHGTFPAAACSISVEFKKIFMNEWTGERYPDQVHHLLLALQATLPGLMDELRMME